jgi:hypothetical protein
VSSEQQQLLPEPRLTKSEHLIFFIFCNETTCLTSYLRLQHVTYDSSNEKLNIDKLSISHLANRLLRTYSTYKALSKSSIYRELLKKDIIFIDCQGTGNNYAVGVSKRDLCFKL